MQGIGYGRRADIWSVGCTVIEMLTGSHPWPDMENPWTAMFHISKSKSGPPRPGSCSKSCREFLDLCFKLQPPERPHAAELLGHRFVSQIQSVISSHSKDSMQHSL